MLTQYILLVIVLARILIYLTPLIYNTDYNFYNNHVKRIHDNVIIITKHCNIINRIQLH